MYRKKEVEECCYARGGGKKRESAEEMVLFISGGRVLIYRDACARLRRRGTSNEINIVCASRLLSCALCVCVCEYVLQVDVRARERRFFREEPRR